MSEKDRKELQHVPSSQSSSSELQASLETLLREVAKGLRGGSAATLKLHELFLEIKTLVESRDATIEETHRRIGLLHAETSEFSEIARKQIIAIQQLIDVAIDNRQSLDAGAQQLSLTHREISQQFATLARTEEKPLRYKVLDFLLPHAVRGSKKAAVWFGVKLAAGGGYFAALWKVIKVMYQYGSHL